MRSLLLAFCLLLACGESSGLGEGKDAIRRHQQLVPAAAESFPPRVPGFLSLFICGLWLASAWATNVFCCYIYLSSVFRSSTG
jgi:hypothetical protein